MNTQTTPRSKAELNAIHTVRNANIKRSKTDGHLSPISNDERFARFVDAKKFNEIFSTTPPIQIIKA